MSIDDITSYCSVVNCTVRFGDPEIGFLKIDGYGIQEKYNYRRFLAHHELSELPSPLRVLGEATVFEVLIDGKTRKMSPEEFQKVLDSFKKLVGI